MSERPALDCKGKALYVLQEPPLPLDLELQGRQDPSAQPHQPLCHCSRSTPTPLQHMHHNTAHFVSSYIVMTQLSSMTHLQLDDFYSWDLCSAICVHFETGLMAQCSGVAPAEAPMPHSHASAQSETRSCVHVRPL